MGHPTVSTPAVPQRVRAWVLWEDGAEELVEAYAVAWTQRAVLVEEPDIFRTVNLLGFMRPRFVETSSARPHSG
jgi:hypothetical protein